MLVRTRCKYPVWDDWMVAVAGYCRSHEWMLCVCVS
jgi:hypothetical protein